MDLPKGKANVMSPGWPDRAISEIAARQRTLITRRQLLGLAVSNSAVGRATARGRLHRVHQGVYSLVAAQARPLWTPEHAAVLACGEDAVLSHRSAARVHGLTVHGPTLPLEVTLLDSHRKASHRGIVVHSTAALARGESHRLDRLPVTSVARTAIDLSPQLSDHQLEVFVDEALHRTSRAKLLEALELHRGRPGTPALRALLDPSRPSSLVWSQVEDRLRRMIRRAGLPMPEANVWLTPRYRPDLLWREQRVIVEYVSDQWHSGPRSARRDDARHNQLTADGHQVLQITRAHAPEQVLVWIAQALARADAG